MLDGAPCGTATVLDAVVSFNGKRRGPIDGGDGVDVWVSRTHTAVSYAAFRLIISSSTSLRAGNSPSYLLLHVPVCIA